MTKQRRGRHPEHPESSPPRSSTPEFSHTVSNEELARGALSLDLSANEAERAGLARRFGLVAIKRLEARVTVTPHAEGITLDGELEGEVTQSCVVTLEPVDSTIASRFAVRYISPDDFAARMGGEEEEEFLDAESEDIEPLPEQGIDAGEVVAQYMALALDPYPRKEGVELGEIGGPSEASEPRPGPFDVLKKLQDRG